MEDDFFKDRLKFFGLDVDVPNEQDRSEIQDMQSQISAGNVDEGFGLRFRNMLSRYSGYDALILGCTELPLVITETETDIPIINPIHAQCDEALKLVLASIGQPQEREFEVVGSS